MLSLVLSHLQGPPNSFCARGSMVTPPRHTLLTLSGCVKNPGYFTLSPPGWIPLQSLTAALRRWVDHSLPFLGEEIEETEGCAVTQREPPLGQARGVPSGPAGTPSTAESLQGQGGLPTWCTRPLLLPRPRGSCRNSPKPLPASSPTRVTGTCTSGLRTGSLWGM